MIDVSRMNRLTALIVSAFVIEGAAASAQTSASRADEEAIQSITAATTKAFNEHDAKGWASYCTPDARLVTVRGESMDGVAEIEKGLTSVFQTRARSAKLRTLDMSVRFVRPDVALTYVTNEMSGLVDAAGRQLPSHRELSIRVFVKNGGTWKISAFHNTMLP